MHQRGFGSVALILIILTVLAVSGIWYYESQKASLTQQDGSVLSGESVTSAPNATSNRSTVTPSPSSSPSSEAILAATCATPFDETTTVDNSLLEIKAESLFVNGHEEVTSIPTSLGLPSQNAGVGFQDPNTNPCVNPSGNPPTSTLVYDLFTNMEPSSVGDEVAVIYFQDQYTPDDSEFVLTASKLLVYSATGKLLSSSDLKVWNSVDQAYERYWSDGSIISFDGSTTRFVSLDEKGGEAIQSIHHGIVTSSP
jgi:hypothetical protein